MIHVFIRVTTDLSAMDSASSENIITTSILFCFCRLVTDLDWRRQTGDAIIDALVMRQNLSKISGGVSFRMPTGYAVPT